MSMNHEKRINKLEQISPPQSLPWIRLVRDDTETLADAFKKSGHPGCLEDYLVICRVIIDPPKSEDNEDLIAFLHPVQTN